MYFAKKGEVTYRISISVAGRAMSVRRSLGEPSNGRHGGLKLDVASEHILGAHSAQRYGIHGRICSQPEDTSGAESLRIRGTIVVGEGRLCRISHATGSLGSTVAGQLTEAVLARYILGTHRANEGLEGIQEVVCRDYVFVGVRDEFLGAVATEIREPCPDSGI